MNSLFENLLKLILKVFCYVLIVILFITFAPGIPPNHVQFESYTIKPSMKLEGKLAPNTILNNVKTLKVDGDISGLESVEIRGDELYMGDSAGRLIKIKNGKATTVAKMEFPCDEVFRHKCSWPLGVRFDTNGKLLFIDIYGGLLRANVDTGVVEHLLTRGEYVDGDPISCPNDLDVSREDGAIYFSDSASTATVETIHNGFYGHPSGRLLKFEPSKNKTTVLMKNIHMTNGVQLSSNEDFILVSELNQFRILRYYLKGEKKGQSDIFIDGLPGYPDNIRPNNKSGFYLSIFSMRPETDLGQYPLLRKFLARTIFLIEYFTSRLYNNFPNQLTKSIYSYGHSIFGFKITEPRNALILELNEKGEILKSLQSTNSALHGISQVTIGETYTYLVSPFNTKIWYLNTADL